MDEVHLVALLVPAGGWKQAQKEERVGGCRGGWKQAQKRGGES